MMEVIYDGVVLDLADDEVVPITKQVNEVGKLDSFKSDFTREFKVKRTRKMEALFQNASSVNSETNLPYEALEVKVKDGVELIPKGRLAINRVDNLFYFCSIYSGASFIFDTLKELTINNIDLSDLSHTWDAITAANSLKNDTDYQYLLADYSDDGLLIGDTDPLQFNIEELRCCVRVKYIFDKIFEGYKLESDIANDEYFNRMFIPINTLKTSKESVQGFLAETDKTIPAPNGIIILDNIIFDPFNTISSNAYHAKVSGKHFFFLGYRNSPLDFVAGPDYIEGFVGGVVVSEHLEKNNFGFYLSADLLVGDSISFKRPATELPFKPYAGVSFLCYNIESSIMGAGTPIAPAEYLPAINQSEFVKAICGFFGLVPDYDFITNTIKLWSINRLYENKYIAKDWSEYLSVEDEVLNFRLDYARLNRFKWKEDKDVGLGNGDAMFAVNDFNLPKEKTILEMPMAGCDEVIHSGEKMARIGWFESIPNSADYKQKESITPRMVLREPMAVATKIGAQSLTIAQSFKATSIDLQVSIAYNDATVRMLRQTKKMVVKMNLPKNEIESFDPKIPVYIKQYSAYFYVPKISNFIPNMLCEVELIRLP